MDKLNQIKYISGLLNNESPVPIKEFKMESGWVCLAGIVMRLSNMLLCASGAAGHRFDVIHCTSQS